MDFQDDWESGKIQVNQLFMQEQKPCLSLAEVSENSVWHARLTEFCSEAIHFDEHMN